MSTSFISAIAPKARLTESLEHAPPHLQPVLLAVRDYGCGWGTIAQGAGRFDLPNDRPTIIVLGDDLYEALGPSAFHRKSLKRILPDAAFIGIVACEAIPAVYGHAAGIAATYRKNAVVIETRPEQEIPWRQLVAELAPGIPLVVATVKPGHA